MNKRQSYYVGVDGCHYGWFAVILDEKGNWDLDKFKDINELWKKLKNVKSILIDMPIGLRDSGEKERLCDNEARKFLNKGDIRRGSSVFPVPCREAAYASNYEKAKRINCKRTGRKLSKQTWNISRKIRQLDEFLQVNTQARKLLKETHPEVCFAALSGGKPMKFSKSKTGEREKGLRERKGVLRKYCDVDNLFRRARAKFPYKKYVSDDDILDALVAAVSAQNFGKNPSSLPEKPEKDSKGLPMQIVYYKP